MGHHDKKQVGMQGFLSFFFFLVYTFIIIHHWTKDRRNSWQETGSKDWGRVYMKWLLTALTHQYILLKNPGPNIRDLTPHNGTHNGLGPSLTTTYKENGLLLNLMKVFSQIGFLSLRLLKIVSSLGKRCEEDSILLASEISRQIRKVLLTSRVFVLRTRDRVIVYGCFSWVKTIKKQQQ